MILNFSWARLKLIIQFGGFTLAVFLSITAIFFSETAAPRAIENGLVLSGMVRYPENNAMSVYFLNSWNFPSQLTALLIFLKIPLSLVSIVILVIPLLMNFYGVYFLLRKFSSTCISLLFATVFVFFSPFKTLTLDYPVMLLSEHTFGIWSFAITTLIIGLYVNKFYFWNGFLSLFSIAIHPVIGLFVFMFNTSYLLINHYLFKGDSSFLFRFINGVQWAVLPTAISLIIYWAFKVNYIADFNLSAFNEFRFFWDTHRDIGISIKSVTFNIVLIILVMLYVKWNRITDHEILYVFILTITCLFVYTLKPIYPNFFVNAMFHRINILTAFLMPLIFLGVSLACLKKRYVSVVISTFLIFSIANNLGLIKIGLFTVPPPIQFTSIYNCIYVYKCKNIFDVQFDLFREINIHNSSLALVAPSVSRNVFIEARIPYILDSASFDFVSYHPKTATEVLSILSSAYGLGNNFFRIGYGGLKDSQIQLIFENRSLEDWTEVSYKFNFALIVVPPHWNISLPLLYKNNEFAIYNSRNLSSYYRFNPSSAVDR